MKFNLNNKISHKETHYLPEIELHKIISAPSKSINNLDAVSERVEVINKSVSHSANKSQIYWLLGAVFLIVSLIIGYFLMNDRVEKSDAIEHHTEQMDSADQAIVDNDYSSVLTEEAITNGCVIITGTFKDQRNIKAMSDHIASLDYQVYQSDNNGLVRVGLRFDCNNQNLDEYLSRIQDQISAKSWYLIPDYSPEL